mmetsp:Transcript_12291/g.28756  ORF Transcript_12291/g.28756 Transcript_12291/m.28756 type:complete len:214 (+) Transcript_12291:66-707(+)
MALVLHLARAAREGDNTDIRDAVADSVAVSSCLLVPLRHRLALVQLLLQPPEGVEGSSPVEGKGSSQDSRVVVDNHRLLAQEADSQRSSLEELDILGGVGTLAEGSQGIRTAALDVPAVATPSSCRWSTLICGCWHLLLDACGPDCCLCRQLVASSVVAAAAPAWDDLRGRTCTSYPACSHQGCLHGRSGCTAQVSARKCLRNCFAHQVGAAA